MRDKLNVSSINKARKERREDGMKQNSKYERGKTMTRVKHRK